MVAGVPTLEMWDISIRNRDGRTRVAVGRDMRDPDITDLV